MPAKRKAVKEGRPTVSATRAPGGIDIWLNNKVGKITGRLFLSRADIDFLAKLAHKPKRRVHRGTYVPGR